MPKSWQDIIDEALGVDPAMRQYSSETTQNFRPMMDRSGPMTNVPGQMTPPDLEASSFGTQYDLMYNPNTLDRVPKREPPSPIDRISPNTKFNDAPTWQEHMRKNDALDEATETSRLRTINPDEISSEEMMLGAPPESQMPMLAPKDYMQSKPELYDMEQLMKYYTQGGGENI
jgi:hypothetical protein